MNFDPSQLKKYINIAFISILVLISFMLLLSILSTAGLMASGIISIIINAVILGVGIFSYIKLKNIAKNIEIEDIHLLWKKSMKKTPQKRNKIVSSLFLLFSILIANLWLVRSL